MAFTKSPRYEISSKLGGDSELGNEKAHIGGYGGDDAVGLSFKGFKGLGKGLGKLGKGLGKGFYRMPGGALRAVKTVTKGFHPAPGSGWRRARKAQMAASTQSVGDELGNESEHIGGYGNDHL